MTNIASIDPVLFRKALSNFPTGVTVISTHDPDLGDYGITVSSFASLSLDPPLICWSLRLDAYSYSIFKRSSHFAVNVLAADQRDVSQRFCANTDRFSQTDCEHGLFGLPLVAGAAAWLECELAHELPGGDHSIFVGRVLKVHSFAKKPLLHWLGNYHEIANADDAEELPEKQVARG